MRELLRVECGKIGRGASGQPWSRAQDECFLAPGFDYALRRGRSAAARDDEQWCWYDADRLEVEISCPPGTSGRLGLHIYDSLGFNNRDHEKLEVRIVVAGRVAGTCRDLFPVGKLIEVSVGPLDTAGGGLGVIIEKVKLGAVLNTLLFAEYTKTGEEEIPEVLSLAEADVEGLSRRLRMNEDRLMRLDELLSRAGRCGRDIAGPRATRSILDRYVGYARWALANGRAMRKGRADYIIRCGEQALAIGEKAENELQGAVGAALSEARSSEVFQVAPPCHLTSLPASPADAPGAGCLRRPDAMRDAAPDQSSSDREPRPANGAPHSLASTGRLEIENGVFLQDGAPVLFSGPSVFCPSQRPLLPWGEAINEFMPFIAGCGFNLAELHIGPAQVIRDRIEFYDIAADILSTLDCAESHGVYIALSLTPWNNVNSIHEAYPDMRQPEDGNLWLPGCLLCPDTRDYVSRYLARLIPVVKGHPALHCYSLSQEPHVEEYCGRAVGRFRQWIEDTYRTVEECNRAWDAGFARIGDIVPNRAISNPGLRYDWQTFQQALATEFFRWMRGIIADLDPVTPCYIRTLSDVFTEKAGDSRSGIDREALGDVCEINGTTCATGYPGKRYALEEFGRHSMVHDLLRSLDPPSPVFDGENHLHSDLHSDYYPSFLPADFVRTTLWLKFLHGVSAQTSWTLTSHGGWEYNLFTQPEAVDALARATIDIRRLASRVVQFRQAPAEVAILFSMASKLHSTEHAIAVRGAYEALRFLDAKIDFVTERQVLSGKLDRYKLVLVTQADHVPEDVCSHIRSYVKEGGSVLFTGRSLNHSEHGLARGRMDLLDANWQRFTGTPAIDIDRGAFGDGMVFIPRTAFSVEELSYALEEILNATAVARRVRVLDERDGRMWGVEARSVVANQNALMYLINLNHHSRFVRLEAGGPIVRAVDLIRSEELPGPSFELKSLDPMLLELIL